MIKLCDNSSCTGCMSCVQTCNKGAISVRKDEWGFSFPSIDNSKCVECGLCIKKCHISNPCETSYPRSFYSYRGSDEERLKSSSGSFFPLISSFFINKGYYVVGVVYNDDFLSAKYVITQSLEVVDKMRKSKYFEAEIGDIYSKVKKILNSGEKVLFVGLPCHVAGLLKFVNNRQNLITMDLLCFGAGSPYIYGESLKSFLRKNKYQIKDLKKVDFRHKPFIDNQHTILDLCFPDRTFMFPADSFPYYRGFVNQLVFRESCYECRYNCINRCSDLTIGDILGNSDILGANVIFCNTIMGEKIIEDLRVQNIIIEMEDNEIQINANRFLPKKKPNYYHLMKKIKYYPLLEKFYLSNRKPIISRVIVRIKRRIRFLLSK